MRLIWCIIVVEQVSGFIIVKLKELIPDLEATVSSFAPGPQWLAGHDLG